MSVAKLKSLKRNNAKSLRADAHLKGSVEASHKISNHIIKFLITRPEIKVVALYRPIQTEIDIRPVESKIRNLGKTLCLPVIISENEPLDFIIWNENVSLVEGRFKVQIPLASEIIEPDLILCPMLSFDLMGYRLGYGGGFYDRTIDLLEKKKPIFTLGCAYSQQVSVKRLPIDKYDKPLDGVVTECGMIFFNSGQ